MQFARPEYLWFLIPAIIVVLAVRWRRRRSYFSHPSLDYLVTRLRPASRLVYLPRFLEIVIGSTIAQAVVAPFSAIALAITYFRLRDAKADMEPAAAEA